MSIEAMKQALEAMGLIDKEFKKHGRQHWFEAVKARAAITALRASLAEPVLAPAPGYCKHCKQYTIEEPLPAEPVQEPVAWMIYTEGGTSAYVTDNPNDLVGAYRALALYTAPLPRKPLTDEKVCDLWSWSMTTEAERTATTQQHAFARAIERAHGIGGSDD